MPAIKTFTLLTFVVVTIACALSPAGSALAQEGILSSPFYPTPSVADTADITAPEDPGLTMPEPAPEPIDFSLIEPRGDANPAGIPSLFFTREDLREIEQARNRQNDLPLAPPPRQRQRGEPLPPKEPGIRELSLAGISYVGHEDWTLWLNGRRITPRTLPEQIMDIEVFDNAVQLMWYDEFYNRIYPVRLEPNQRFNLDSRIFFTGATHQPEDELR